MSIRLAKTVFAVAMALLLTAPVSAQQTYGTRDAEYVTNSRNDAVLRYIVCLELVVGTLPGSMGIETRLTRAETDCAGAAARLPNSSREPDVASIRGMIMECGFRPGEGSPDAGCAGVQPVGNNPNKPNSLSPRPGPFVADEVYLDPRVIELGKWIEGITYDGQWLWASESGQRTIAKVDLRSGKLIERYNVGRLPIDVVSTGDGSIYTLVATDKVILRHDARGKKSTLATIKDCPDAMIPAGNNLFVLGEPSCSSERSRVIRIDTARGKQANSGELGEWAQSMVASGNDIWVGHARGPSISIVNQNTLKTTNLPLSGIEVWALAANAQYVFAGGRYENTDQDGSVVTIDARTHREVSRFSVTERVAEMTADDNHVVVVGEKGTIWILSTVDQTLLRTIRPSTGEYAPRTAMIVNDSLVISANIYRGENGAVFIFDNYLPVGMPMATSGGSRQAGLNPRNNQPNQPVLNPRNNQPNRPGVGNQANRPGVNNQPNRPLGNPRNNQPNRPVVNNQTNRPLGNPRNNRPNRPGVNPTRNGRGGTATMAGFPIEAGSGGGRIRSGPSTDFPSPGSTREGQGIRLVENTGIMLNGYPWFKIEYGRNKSGYQWGGLICAINKPISGTEGVCPRHFAAVKDAGKNNAGPNRPQLGNNRGGNNNRGGRAPTNLNDVIIGGLNLLGKALDQSNRNKNGGNATNGGRNNNGNANAGAGNNGNRNNGTNNGGRNNAGNTNANSGPSLFEETVNLAAGAGIQARSRSVDEGSAVIYTIRGIKGQTLRTEVVSPNGNAVFGIYIDKAAVGGAMLPGAGDDDMARFFEGELPVGTTYQIVVASIRGRASFRIEMSLENFNPATAQGGNNGNQQGTNASGGRNNGGGGTNVQTAAGARNQLAVGTYRSTKATSGNIELNGSLMTWTEFCGPSNVLTPDWGNNRLAIDTNPQGEFRLQMRNGQVTGFTFGNNTYTKANGIIMPGCAGAPAAAANAPDPNSFGDDGEEDAFADPRASTDYSMIAPQDLQACQANNPEVQNAPNTGLFDCLDAARIVALEAQEDVIADARSQNDYTRVPAAVADSCSAANPADKDFYNCMDQALMDALESLDDAADDANTLAVNSRANQNYPDVPDAQYLICVGTYGEGTPAFVSCLDDVMTVLEERGTGAYDANGQPIDPRADTGSSTGVDYGSLPMGYFTTCAQNYGEGSSQYYDCLDQGLITEANNAQAGANPDPNSFGADGEEDAVVDPRANTIDYTSLPMGYFSTCAQDYGEGSSQYYDCLDNGLITENANNNAQPVQDPRATTIDYSSLTPDVFDYCRNESGEGTSGYYDCLDAGLSQASRANAQAVDPRAGNDWSDLTEEEKIGCETYGFETSDYFTCFENVRANKDAQYQQEQADQGAAEQQRLDQEAADAQYQQQLQDEAAAAEQQRLDQEAADAQYQQQLQDEAAAAAQNQQQEYVQEPSQDAGQAPGWDRATVLYQAAYDYCINQMGLTDPSDEYTQCYFAYQE